MEIRIRVQESGRCPLDAGEQLDIPKEPPYSVTCFLNNSLVTQLCEMTGVG